MRLEAVKGCSSKIAYRTKAEFNKHRRTLNMPGKRKLYAYRCPKCGQIHGSSSPSRTGDAV
jgi:uncharacterized OB-fold protein